MKAEATAKPVPAVMVDSRYRATADTAMLAAGYHLY